MNIKLELLKDHITNYICSQLKDFDIDANEIVNTNAICILSEIQKILSNQEYNDFEVVEEIVSLFERNGIYCGGRHDFG